MRYVSTRDHREEATLSEAISRGIAPDGGLYVPERFPATDPAEISAADSIAAAGELCETADYSRRRLTFDA